MADKRKDQNVDPMQSIFDFIFAQTQKPAEKRRPVRVSNISGSSELTDVLTTVLEKPGLHVADQAMNNLNDALSLQIAEIYTASGAPQQKTKIFTKDLLTIFTDQNKFFDALYEKNKRKIKLADYAGKSFRGLNAASVAKKLGIDDWEDRWAINRAAAEYEDPSERLAVVNSASKIGRKYLAIDSFTKGSEEAFSSGISGYRAEIIRAGKDLDNANIQNANELRIFLSRDRFFRGQNAAIQEIVNQYQSKEGKFYHSLRNSIKEKDLKDAGISNLKDYNHWEETLQKGFKDRLDRSAPENINMFRDISSKYYAGKGHLYKAYGDGDDSSKGVAYDKMSLLMLNWKKSQKKILGKQVNNLKVVRGNIKTLKRLGVLSSVQQRKLDDLKKAEKELKSEVKFLNRTNAQDKYYQMRGYWGSMKDVWGKNLGASILDGTFFTGDNKILNPVSQSELGVHKVGRDGIYFNINDKDNAYCRTMTTVMYLTPKKLLKMDGTYFAYRAYRNRMDSFNKLISQMKALGGDKLADILYKDLEVLGLFGKGSKGELLINYDAFEDPAVLRGKLAGLRAKYGGDPDIRRLLDIYMAKEGQLYKLVSTFSIIARLKENLKRKIDKATIGKIRGAIAGRLITRFGGDLNLKNAIIGWSKGGGIQGLYRGFVDKLLKKMGFQAFALTTVSGALTAVLANFTFKIYIIFAKVLVTALIGLIFILGAGFSFGNSLMQKYSPVSHIEPGEVIQCEGFEPEGLVNPETTIDIDVPVPSDASCPFGTIALYCTQGYVGDRGKWSHSTIRAKKPVDLAAGGAGFYFYAPQYCDKGGCKVTSARAAGGYRCLSPAPAGDEVIFNDGQGNEFIIVHSKALVPVGQSVSAGQAVAYIYGRGELPTGSCWSGSHVHLEIRQNGQYIDPPSLLQGMGCGVPSESQCYSN